MQSSACRRFGMVGADQWWTSNGEAKLGFVVDAADPDDIAAALPERPPSPAHTTARTTRPAGR
jgi:hypothetical protein